MSANVDMHLQEVLSVLESTLTKLWTMDFSYVTTVVTDPTEPFVGPGISFDDTHQNMGSFAGTQRIAPTSTQ